MPGSKSGIVGNVRANTFKLNSLLWWRKSSGKKSGFMRTSQRVRSTTQYLSLAYGLFETTNRQHWENILAIKSEWVDITSKWMGVKKCSPNLKFIEYSTDKNLWRRKYVRRAIFRNVEVRVEGRFVPFNPYFVCNTATGSLCDLYGGHITQKINITVRVEASTHLQQRPLFTSCVLVSATDYSRPPQSKAEKEDVCFLSYGYTHEPGLTAIEQRRCIGYWTEVLYRLLNRGDELLHIVKWITQWRPPMWKMLWTTRLTPIVQEYLTKIPKIR